MIFNINCKIEDKSDTESKVRDLQTLEEKEKRFITLSAN